MGCNSLRDHLCLEPGVHNACINYKAPYKDHKVVVSSLLIDVVASLGMYRAVSGHFADQCLAVFSSLNLY